MTSAICVNPEHCTDVLQVDYPHVGLYDAPGKQAWIARSTPAGPSPLRVSHASLLIGGDRDASVAEKDKFLCYWFHTPHTGEGCIQGWLIDWAQGHLLVRLDPHWNHLTQQIVPAHETARVRRNIDQQCRWGKLLFKAYLRHKPAFPLSLHMIGPRAADSMLYVMHSGK